jgi:hypothetical protein
MKRIFDSFLTQCYRAKVSLFFFVLTVVIMAVVVVVFLLCLLIDAVQKSKLS